MSKLLTIDSVEKIPEQYRNTPIEFLFGYHNLGRPHDLFSTAQMLIGMCIDNRKQLQIPEYFAYVIRAGGANLRYSEFKISYSIAIGGIRTMALIGHNHCGMVNLMARKEQFIKGLVDGAGWDLQKAEEQFMQFAPVHEIGNEMDFVLSDVKRLREKYPKILIAPMLYRVEDNLLYMIEE